MRASFFSRMWSRLRPTGLSDAELRRRLVSKERPLTVCFDCRTLSESPWCGSCGQSSSCLEIKTRIDVKNALSGLNLEPTDEPIYAPPAIALDLHAAINRSIAHAKRKQDERVRVEHLLLELLQAPPCQTLLQRCGANVEQLRQQLLTSVPASDAVRSGEPAPTPELEQVMKDAAARVYISGRDILTGADALFAVTTVCEGESSPVGRSLAANGVTQAALNAAAVTAS